MTAKKKLAPTKYEKLHEILGLFGNSVIDREEFWRMMAEQNLSDKDIDDYCDGTISPERPNGFLR